MGWSITTDLSRIHTSKFFGDTDFSVTIIICDYLIGASDARQMNLSHEIQANFLMHTSKQSQLKIATEKLSK